ncbi:MAG: alpha/beta fold hydrolase [Lewinellaceae bacterium]|nr:alpha/beta fold hydrolase [Lewinellaceae bacterium]
MRYVVSCFFFLLSAPALRAQADCNPAYRPVVFVHGFLASGDTWAGFAHGFQAVGYCPDRLVAFDWNTLNQQANHAAALDAVIDAVRTRTGAAQVDLIGHSAGGGLGYTYLSDSARATKVARYVHIGSMNQKQPAGPTGTVPTLNLWSDGDRVVPGKEIPGATNIMLPGLDHYQIATSAESIITTFLFFLNDAPIPQVPEWTPSEQVRIGGRALFFGENKPAAHAAVELYYLDPGTGRRSSGTAVATVTADEQGYWAMPEVRTNVPVELVVLAGADARPVHYFREGFVQPHNLVYLRALPGPGTLVSMLLAGLPKSPRQAVINVFSSGQAVVFGRDSLFVNGIPLATEQHAAPEKTAISFFLYDGNDNQQSDLTSVGLFGKFPFLSGVDLFVNPDDAAPLEIVFNGRRQVVRKIRSSDGIQVVVFE